jgi:Putative restriction endonuclease
MIVFFSPTRATTGTAPFSPAAKRCTSCTGMTARQHRLHGLGVEPSMLTPLTSSRSTVDRAPEGRAKESAARERRAPLRLRADVPRRSEPTGLQARRIGRRLALFMATRRYLAQPVLTVEVESPATVRHDRGVKIDRYREIASVREIVLISSVERRCQVWRREDRRGRDRRCDAAVPYLPARHPAARDLRRALTSAGRPPRPALLRGPNKISSRPGARRPRGCRRNRGRSGTACPWPSTPRA